MASASQAPLIDLTQDDDSDEEEVEVHCFGRFKTQVVGVRYYTGLVNMHEMVTMVREPLNPYDRNAIRVDNVVGAQVGHIAREQAALLAPLIDSGDLHIEGLATGQKGVYKMPIVIYCFGPPDRGEAVRRRLRLGAIMLDPVDPLNPTGDLTSPGARGGARGGAGGGGAGGAGAVQVLSQQELDNSLDRMFDELGASAEEQDMLEPPPGALLSGLYPHQKAALAWMVARENESKLPPFYEPINSGGAVAYLNTLTNHTSNMRPQPIRGGILADDMGLGKTLTIIALITTNRPGVTAAELTPFKGSLATGAPGVLDSPAAQGKTAARSKRGQASDEGGEEGEEVEEAAVQRAGTSKAAAGKGKAKGKGAGAAAAAAAAFSSRGAGGAGRKRGAAAQEEEEEDEDDGAGVYQPRKKKKGPAGRAQAATAAGATSVSLLQASQSQAARAKERKAKEEAAAQAAARTQAAAAADANQPPALLPKASGPRATLVICPLSVLSNWQAQLEEHCVPGSLKVYSYHGASRNTSPTFLASHDVVLTTYGTLASDFSGAPNSGLRGVSWLRVVLDEAHTAKNPDAKHSKAVAALKAERRWAVTGTPIQNSLKDLRGLCAALKLSPLNDRAIFTRALERPVRARDVRGVKKLQVLMGSIALRRDKTMRVAGKPLVCLPSRTLTLVPIALTPEDREKYDRLEREAAELVGGLLAEGSLLTHYSSVLEIILRLRQICDAGSLCPLESLEGVAAALQQAREARARAAAGGAAGGSGRRRGQAVPPEEMARLMGHLEAAAGEECPICLSAMTQAVVTLCAHVFCKGCIEDVLVRDKPQCPLCRGPLGKEDLFKAPPAPAPELPKEEAEQQQGAAARLRTAAAGAAGVVRSAKVAELITRLKANSAADVAAMQAALAALTGGLGDSPPSSPGITAGAEAVPGSAAGPSSSSQPLASQGALAAAATPTKAVVFSQFTGMLDQVEAALLEEAISYVRLDGSTPAKARADAIRAFSSRAFDSPCVFLVSLKAGGTGLNLVAACQVHLLDPWWNPSVEEQAADRVHRLGQTRDVKVFRYIAEDTIEERMLQLQERKRELAAAAFDRRSVEENRLARIGDVRLLMRL